jgi:hypothetical protein
MRCYKLLDLLAGQGAGEEMRRYQLLLRANKVRSDPEAADQLLQLLSQHPNTSCVNIMQHSQQLAASEAMLCKLLQLFLQHAADQGQGLTQTQQGRGAGQQQLLLGEGLEQRIADILLSSLHPQAAEEGGKAVAATGYYDQLEQYLMRGQVQSAIDYALAHRDYAYAMLIASSQHQLPQPAFQQVIQAFSTTQALPQGLYLYNMYMSQQAERTILYAGSMQASTGLGSNYNSSVFLEHWRQYIACMLCNKQRGEYWKDMLSMLGQRLLIEHKASTHCFYCYSMLC